MPAPYLDVPLWNSEEEDMQRDVAAHCAVVANRIYLKADRLCEAMDVPEWKWKPGDLGALETTFRELERLEKMLIGENIMEKEREP